MKPYNNRSGRELAVRYISFLAVLFVIAFGTSLSIRANLGSSPISAPPYVLSLIPGVSLTMGQFTICMHIIFIITQILLLRRNFERIQLLQILVSFVFGIYTDLTMWLTGFLQIFDNTPIGYSLRFVELLCGGAILAIGIAAEVKCDVLMLAGEGLPLAISKVTKRDFGRVKICSDTGLVCFGVIFMLAFFHHWDWEMIGPGTLVSMFYVGAMVRVFSPHLVWLDDFFRRFTPESMQVLAEEIQETAVPLVITISREYGSGGNILARQLAQRLGINFYDSEIIDKTAAELGYSSEYVAQKEQNISSGKLWELIFTDNSIPPSMNPSQDDAIFVSQGRTIRHLASTQSCIIVGRLANWVLRGRKNLLRVFVTSDIDSAMARVMEREQISRDEARAKIASVNRRRSNHYWAYTHHSWAGAHGYDLIINTGKLGIEGSLQLITESLKLMTPA